MPVPGRGPRQGPAPASRPRSGGGLRGAPSIVDGNDVVLVREAMAGPAERARAGEGPGVLEALTYRHFGHSRADPATYRPAEEVERWLKHDPLDLARARRSPRRRYGGGRRARREDRGGGCRGRQERARTRSGRGAHRRTGGLGFGAQHSQATESWAFAVPGPKIAAPATPTDVIGMMAAAIRSDDPVVFFEHKGLLATKGSPAPRTTLSSWGARPSYAKAATSRSWRSSRWCPWPSRPPNGSPGTAFRPR
ncbi:thiamine pyrophosphate-dependent enzyme [Streptomyces sp. NBC_00996]|uniref:thiamine pyrophosphate-dependent enzyme n=1 Tax=Streptomyces sp. NBC_00996 TaxID=2903710 RepID=UPI00386C8DF3|nr:thiamine pyrophosphate-dependent enzyme [Streptomyces sp. NBC_00996]